MRTFRKPDEKQHQKWLKKRRRHALEAVLMFSPYEQFKTDYGAFMRFLAHIKAALCLLTNRLSDDIRDKELLTVYDEYFNVDHWDWRSVWINPNWFKDWTVSLREDGE